MEHPVFPFLWMRGEEESILRTEIAKIYEANIRGVCVEARPHPDFCGPGWWHDMDIVLDEAEKRGMQVWILDDAHFPTGQSNGLIPAKYPHLARRYIYTQHVDVTGPIPCGSLDVELMTTRKTTWMDFAHPHEKPLIDEHIRLSVTAAQIAAGDTLTGQMLCLDPFVKDGILTWDVPDGTWRVFVSFITTDFGARNDYINYIDAESVKVQLEAAYEPHYARYKEKFGKTIRGFFSDEPGFYNVDGFKMDEAIGRKLMPLPWCSEMEGRMLAALGPQWKEKLPYLWYAAEESAVSAAVRFAYMDNVTRLYEKNFCNQIGEWCRSHGVAYIGHVIEDNNQHTRLGAGAGHFFRALAGQDMAGIDNIGNQIIPGRPDANRHTPAYIGDGEFFHYGLPKLGASAAQIDPKKHGRLMCENFGAYGWSMGVKNMKWLTDYLLLQGVNRFVPHAFSMRPYPDDDCPPHFYARGNNPQYPFFGKLMAYADRMCRLLEGGTNVPQAAVLYEAEADWMGKTMPSQKPVRALFESQIECEIIPADVFTHAEYYGTKVENSVLTVNGRSMKVLIVPGCEAMGPDAAAFLMANPELPVVFVEQKPAFIPGFADPAFLDRYPCVSLQELPAFVRHLGCTDVVLDHPQKNLGVYHYRKNSDIYFLMNTSLSQTVEAEITLPAAGQFSAINPWNEKTLEVFEGEKPWHLTLAPYESLLLITEPGQQPKKAQPAGELDISGNWELELAEVGENGLQETINLVKLEPVNLRHPDFSGQMVYTREISLDADAEAVLTVQHLFEAADVLVDGRLTDCRICPPYRFELGKLTAGKHIIKVCAVNTAVRNANKTPCIFGIDREILEPSGMFGTVALKLYN